MLKVGDTVHNAREFTTPIGEWFRSGTTFRVALVGSVNARAQAPNGSLVWIEMHNDGTDTFLTNAPRY